MEGGKKQKPYGMPLLEGKDVLLQKDWQLIYDFIKSKIWDLKEPCLETDREDPLLMSEISYGKLMLGFDFHLTQNGPKLIEINTNAGGLASVFTFERADVLRKHIEMKFIEAIITEFNLARNNEKNSEKPTLLAIVDDNVEEQGMYPEMLAFSELLNNHSIPTVVISQNNIKMNEEKELFFNNQKIEMIYNRICDFRLVEEKNKLLRESLLNKKVVITPHPYSYVRCGDKRNLLLLQEIDKTFNVIPKTFQLKDKPIEEWIKTKKDFVFKPPSGNGSKGVYRGDKISISKLKSLDDNTIVQEFCPPAVSDDNSKYDIRVYTRDSDILGLASRHFTGQIMEMTSPLSGLKAILPDNVCCFPFVDLNNNNNNDNDNMDNGNNQFIYCNSCQCCCENNNANANLKCNC